MLTSGDLIRTTPLHPSGEEISLYFHIPFCTKKCHYCHFFVLPDKKPYHNQLLEALLLDVTRWAPQLSGKKLVSIYFGGGTPSLLDPTEIHQILEHVQTVLPFDASSSEITLEANPETITLERMRAFSAAGINRVSIGVQSLDDTLLKKLGRTHDAQTSVKAIETTASAGIHNISIDLMYDIPGQTLASWHTTLDALSTLPITHLSLYNLTIEPHTVFFKYQEKLQKELPDADSSTQMYKSAQETLEKFGLKQYEISAFAKNDAYSRHNVGYWTGRPFIGFGPSAFSYWDGRRFRAVSNLNRYSEALHGGTSPEDFTETLNPEAHRRELLAIALRLKQGVDVRAFEAVNGPLDAGTHKTIQKLVQDGLLTDYTKIIKLTDRGVLFYDTVATDIV